MRKTFLAILAATLLPMGSVAQDEQQGTRSILDRIDIDAPEQLVTAKSGYVNVRFQPSTSAQKVRVLVGDGDSYEVKLPYYQVWAVKSETDNWWNTSMGYVSKSVTKIVPNDPIPADRINKHLAGYNGEDMDAVGTWRIGRNRETGLVLCQYYDNPKDAFFIGREFDNVFCFQYSVYVVWEYEETAKIKVNKLENTDESTGRKVGSYYKVTYGPLYAVTLKHPYNPDEKVTYPNLTKLPKAMLEYIFKDAIESGEEDIFYVNSYMMSDKFYPFAW